MYKKFICTLSVLFVLLVTFIPSAALASSTTLSVYDVTANSLSVRIGPGTTYSTIATISKGADVIEYCNYGSPADCRVTQNSPRYDMLKAYYPVSSIGQYSTSAVGWIAEADGTSGSMVSYLNHAFGGVVQKSGGTPRAYSSTCPSFSGPNQAHWPNGTSIPGDRADWISDGGVEAQMCNVNAWRMGDPEHPYDASYGYPLNGWHLNSY
ncbi:hypothetical protein GCM10008018_53980 [Paenibacillus marchantiophytorum]|uniref:Uncharacterized protein n=1 Tax=Paenibacillus marchantiophytorum TaxID=1619310 RepID=A0ABQ1F6P8_9BACL|nr:hypothetical protein GCM10008018_53980 [Paenibacillus marchantiophytorum]